MARKGTKKGRSVTLPDAWFLALEQYKKERRVTFEVMGAELEPYIGEPVPISTLHGYLRRRVGVTEELTLALAALTGLEPPPLGSDSTDPDVAELADLGRQLKIAAPDLFQQQLGVMRALAAALKRNPTG